MTCSDYYEDFRAWFVVVSIGLLGVILFVNGIMYLQLEKHEVTGIVLVLFGCLFLSIYLIFGLFALMTKCKKEREEEEFESVRLTKHNKILILII